MSQLVNIKGNKYGIAVRLDSDAPFDRLLLQLQAKFTESAKFFKNAKMALTFEGRKLSSKEEEEILEIISQCTNINVVCIIDQDAGTEEYFKAAVDRALMETQEGAMDLEDTLATAESSGNAGQFYKGTLRSGQVIESESSIIVLGDINPGAKVIARGNIVVLGSLKGNAYAGANGNETAFVVALEMRPMQIRIGDFIARSSDKQAEEMVEGAQIAFVDNGNIYIEPVSRNILNDINFR